MSISKIGQSFLMGFTRASEAIPVGAMLQTMSTVDQAIRNASSQNFCQAVQKQAIKFDETMASLPERAVNSLAQKTEQIPADQISSALAKYHQSMQSLSEKSKEEILDDCGKALEEMPGKIREGTVSAFQKGVNAIPVEEISRIISNMKFRGASMETLKKTEPVFEEKIDAVATQFPHETPSIQRALALMPKLRPQNNIASPDVIRSGKEMVALPRVLGNPYGSLDKVDLGVIAIEPKVYTVLLSKGSGRYNYENVMNKAFLLSYGMMMTIAVAGKTVLETIRGKSEEASEALPTTKEPEVAPEEKMENSQKPTWWGIDMQTAGKVAAVGGVAIAGVALAIFSNR